MQQMGGMQQMGMGGYSTHYWSSSCTYGAAWTPAYDYDGQTWYASSTNGWSASETTTKLQIYSYCQKPTCPGHARTDGCTRRRCTPSTSCGCTGTRTSHCFYAGSCTSTGAKADVGRKTFPSYSE